MNPSAMEPFGLALLDYYKGNLNAELLFRRDDGKEVVLPVSYFFRNSDDFSTIENRAVKLCKGRVLDIGAGAGSQSLLLQQLNYQVKSIDIDPGAVSVMKQRGLKDVQCCDIFSFKSGPFDTLLMLGHGIGMVETIDGLDRFLEHAQSFVSINGQIILDSLDVRKSDEKDNIAYLIANKRTGRYAGEIRMQCEYSGKKGPYYGWLQVDEETLKEHAEKKGWKFETLYKEENGNYLAKLTRRDNS